MVQAIALLLPLIVRKRSFGRSSAWHSKALPRMRSDQRMEVVVYQQERTYMITMLSDALRSNRLKSRRSSPPKKIAP